MLGSVNNLKKCDCKVAYSTVDKSSVWHISSPDAADNMYRNSFQTHISVQCHLWNIASDWMQAGRISQPHAKPIPARLKSQWLKWSLQNYRVTTEACRIKLTSDKDTHWYRNTVFSTALISQDSVCYTKAGSFHLMWFYTKHRITCCT